MAIEIPSNLEKIVRDIESIGGRSYLVGGAVIDIIQERKLKEWDIEVYKLSIHQLEDLLKNYGSPNLVGKSFGIIKLRADGNDYDFNIPRKESRIGINHKNFKVEFPDMTPEEAAYRRDLTINSMFFDLINKILLDPYHGLEDLKQGILRHTSDKFTEDPLRVLRIMQLLPRKGRRVADETIELCKKMIDEHNYLPKERIFEEWNKLLMKANNPSLGLQFLEDCSWIKHYPELDALRFVEQNPDWHPEGNVFDHTKLVLDNAAILRNMLPEEWQLSFMYGLLLHDVGKAVTTSEELTSYGHNKAGVPLAEGFMKRITDDAKLSQRVFDIVRYHMHPGLLYNSNAKESAWKRLHNKIPLNIIGYVSKADAAGRQKRSLKDSYPPSNKTFELFEIYGQDKIPMLLMGRDLLKLGYEPGRIIGEILKQAYELQIEEDIQDKETLIKELKSNGIIKNE